MTRHLSRKDIAALIDPRMTTDVIRRNEHRLGLDQARIRLNRRVILYRRTEALNALRAKGFDV
ncbi:MAG: hypothetical protein KA118_04750 [Verrucomicrobia bacterium]|nr:hypothetical protein [Verrucomicrobiota bacterium]